MTGFAVPIEPSRASRFRPCVQAARSALAGAAQRSD